MISAHVAVILAQNGNEFYYPLERNSRVQLSDWIVYVQDIINVTVSESLEHLEKS